MYQNNDVVVIAKVCYSMHGVLLSKTAKYPRSDWKELSEDVQHEKRVMAINAIHKLLSKKWKE